MFGIILRKNITINSDDFQIVSMFAKKSRISFSELVRKATMKYVEEQENLDLAKFLRKNYLSVPEDEEYEIVEALNNIKTYIEVKKELHQYYKK